MNLPNGISLKHEYTHPPAQKYVFLGFSVFSHIFLYSRSKSNQHISELIFLQFLLFFNNILIVDISPLNAAYENITDVVLFNSTSILIFWFEMTPGAVVESKTSTQQVSGSSPATDPMFWTLFATGLYTSYLAHMFVGVPEVLPTWFISHYLIRVTGSDALAIFPSGRAPFGVWFKEHTIAYIPSPFGMSLADDL